MYLCQRPKEQKGIGTERKCVITALSLSLHLLNHWEDMAVIRILNAFSILVFSKIRRNFCEEY